MRDKENKRKIQKRLMEVETKIELIAMLRTVKTLTGIAKESINGEYLAANMSIIHKQVCDTLTLVEQIEKDYDNGVYEYGKRYSKQVVEK